jgi:hypothetical protein
MEETTGELASDYYASLDYKFPSRDDDRFDDLVVPTHLLR